MSVSSVTLGRAQAIYRENVDRIELARHYLSVEFSNIISCSPDTFADSLARLDDNRIWRLLEALSHTYRLNGVFAQVTSIGVDWFELELPVRAITLTGTRPDINAVVFSKHIGRDPLRFAAWLDRYFQKYPDPEEDPRNLNEFRVRDVVHPVLMTRESRGQIGMLDGTHRLVALVRGGATSVRVYAAIRNGRRPRQMSGDATFLMLANLFKRRTGARPSVERVAVMLAQMSTDGRQAVQSYWIDHAQNTQVRQAGARILGSLPKDRKR